MIVIHFMVGSLMNIKYHTRFLTINVITKEEVQRCTFRMSRVIKQFKHRWTGKIFVGPIFAQTITNDMSVLHVDLFLWINVHQFLVNHYKMRHTSELSCDHYYITLVFCWSISALISRCLLWGNKKDSQWSL